MGEYDTTIAGLPSATPRVHALELEPGETLGRYVELVSLHGSILVRPDEVEPWIGHARAALERAPADPVLEIRLRSAIGNTYFRQHRLDEAATELSAAVALLRESPKMRPDLLAEILSNLGIVRFGLGDRDQAKSCFTESLQLLEELYGTRHPLIATAIMNTGDLAANNGEPQAAIAAYRRAITLIEDNYGPEHEKLAGPLNNIGFALMQQGEADEADADLHRALEIWERVLDPDHPNLALPLTTLANIALEQGRFEPARLAAQRALRILETAMGEGSPGTLEAKALLGSALLGSGRADEGNAHLVEVEQRAIAESTPPPLRASLYALLANAYWDARPTVAVEHARRALDLFRSMPSAHASEVEQLEAWLREHPRPTRDPASP